MTGYDLEICPAREIESLLAEAKTSRPADISRRARLGPAETRAFKTLSSEKRRRDWLAGRLAAKRALARRLSGGAGVPLESLEILSLASGQPCLRAPAAHPEVSFSISHCEAGGLCAVARGSGPIGADWEIIPGQGLAFLPLFVHETESRAAALASPEDQIRLWTLKEAVLKLLGLGLACDPKDIRRGEPGGPCPLELHGAARRRWTQLGSPPIAWEQFREGPAIITVACASTLGE